MYVNYAENNMGKIRETFAINQFQNANHVAYYTPRGDVVVNDYLFEIGGPSKKEVRGEKNGIILQDGVLTGSKNVIPLYLIGFLS